MLIKEYRIPLPLTIEEYRIAQLYMIAVSIRGGPCRIRHVTSFLLNFCRRKRAAMRAAEREAGLRFLSTSHTTKVQEVPASTLTRYTILAATCQVIHA